MDHVSTGGWQRTFAEVGVSLPAAAGPDLREQATHDAARQMLADVREIGWTAYFTSCMPADSGLPGGDWKIRGYREACGYTVGFRITRNRGVSVGKYSPSPSSKVTPRSSTRGSSGWMVFGNVQVPPT